MDEQSNDKVALVSGGASGIGRVTALAFAREGTKVVIADMLTEDGEETVRMIKEAGSEAFFVETDVSKSDDVQALINKVIDEYGRLDYAFNNAGIMGEQASTADYTEKGWDRVISINLKGVWLCMKYEIPQMLKQGRGAIVNTSSIVGVVGMRNCTAYVASKHGIVGMTKTAALEYATTGIRVNAVCPGITRTPIMDRLIDRDPRVEAYFTKMEPVGRMGTPEEIAQAVVWLCSDKASFVTGHAMMVDGGMTVQ